MIVLTAAVFGVQDDAAPLPNNPALTFLDEFDDLSDFLPRCDLVSNRFDRLSCV